VLYPLSYGARGRRVLEGSRGFDFASALNGARETDHGLYHAVRMRDEPPRLRVCERVPAPLLRERRAQ
jgi:hypothetical protein